MASRHAYGKVSSYGCGLRLHGFAFGGQICFVRGYLRRGLETFPNVRGKTRVKANVHVSGGIADRGSTRRCPADRNDRVISTSLPLAHYSRLYTTLDSLLFTSAHLTTSPLFLACLFHSQLRQIEEALTPLESKCFTYLPIEWTEGNATLSKPFIFQWCYKGRATIVIDKGRSQQVRMWNCLLRR